MYVSDAFLKKNMIFSFCSSAIWYELSSCLQYFFWVCRKSAGLLCYKDALEAVICILFRNNIAKVPATSLFCDPLLFVHSFLCSNFKSVRIPI